MKREFKNAVFEQFARVGRALGNGHRIELLDLLAQAERSVDELAGEAGLSLANASQAATAGTTSSPRRLSTRRS